MARIECGENFAEEKLSLGAAEAINY